MLFLLHIQILPKQNNVLLFYVSIHTFFAMFNVQFPDVFNTPSIAR